MKKSWVWWTLAFVVGVAVGWFAYASTGKDEALPVRADVGTPATSSQAAVGSSSSAAALQEPQAVPVRVQQAQLRDVSLSLEAHGALAANREVRLSPKVSGRVATVAVDVGDPVSEGQLLLTLEKDELEISVAQAEAAVAAARANLARIQAGARPEEIQQARAQVTQAASNLEQARTHLARITSLYESGAVSQAQLEQAQSQYEVAEAAHTAAVSQLQIVEQGPRDEDIRAVEAQLMQAEAGLAMAKLQLSHAELASTLDGIVADRLVQPGDMIGAGTPAFRIVQIDPVVVRIELGGRDIVRVAPRRPSDVDAGRLSSPRLYRHGERRRGRRFASIPPFWRPDRSAQPRRSPQTRHVGARSPGRRNPNGCRRRTRPGDSKRR